MKKHLKIITLITSLISLGFLVSCDLDAYQESLDKTRQHGNTKLSRYYVQDFVTAVNEKNSEKLKKVMSYKVRENYTSEDIQNLFDMFPSKIKTPDYDHAPGSSGSLYYGKAIDDCYDTFLLQTESGKYFQMSYTLRYFDDYYQRNEGFLKVVIKDENMCAYTCHPDYPEESESEETNKKAIRIQKGELLSGFTETRKVMSTILFYRPVNRAYDVTKDAIQNFLKNSTKYSDFVSHFGEPNLFWYDDVLWEGENQVYYRIDFNKNTDTIREVYIEYSDGTNKALKF